MTTIKQLQDRLAAAAAEIRRNDERMAFQQEQLSKMRDIADERDVALADVAYLRARAEAAEAERDELKNRIGGLDEQVKIQCSDGNWNYNPYMHGMANGLLVAQATMHDLHDFTGLSAPDKWLDSRENAQTARGGGGQD